MTSFKDALREQRKYKSLTQEELAKLMGISRVTIIMWESGKATPSKDEIEKTF